MRDPGTHLVANEAEFDRITAVRLLQLKSVERADAKAGWLIGRKLLRNYPAGAAMLAGMTSTDFAL